MKGLIIFKSVGKSSRHRFYFKSVRGLPKISKSVVPNLPNTKIYGNLSREYLASVRQLLWAQHFKLSCFHLHHVNTSVSCGECLHFMFMSIFQVNHFFSLHPEYGISLESKKIFWKHLFMSYAHKIGARNTKRAKVDS